MARLREDLGQFPAVGLLGPRQTGKTTLALAVVADWPSLYLDLESPSDLAKLEDAEAFLGRLLPIIKKRVFPLTSRRSDHPAWPPCRAPPTARSQHHAA
ncbi:MAG: AAA family ATPase [Candidatus Sericytochromatia bacterium]|nr:AAA family ATPase [Candidatus Sericytochromatia bacterium]